MCEFFFFFLHVIRLQYILTKLKNMSILFYIAVLNFQIRNINPCSNLNLFKIFRFISLQYKRTLSSDSYLLMYQLNLVEI